MRLDHTHDPARRSWVESANESTTDFPIQNLPLGVFRRRGDDRGRIGMAIGDQVLDLQAAVAASLLPGVPDLERLIDGESLNTLFGAGSGTLRTLRHEVFALLLEGSAGRAPAGRCLVPAADIDMQLPAAIGDYSDFYASVHHATNVGSMFRPDNPLLPNYKHIPIGYHGRASSIVPSGTPITRPSGQTRASDAVPPVFGPTRRLDYELEVGAFIAAGNAPGTTIDIGAAEAHIAGLVLVNDWSARDIQAWEYQPLGPFLAKSFATSISPWVVTMDALMPFRTPAFARPDGDPEPMPYLSADADREAGGIDLTLEVFLSSREMRAHGMAPMLVSRGSLRGMYWTFAQIVTHHASNGCNLRPGDLIASGTVSGPTPESRGCLLERTWKGTEPLTLPTGETRTFLESGDEVLMSGHAARDGARRIGLGECRGEVL